MKIGYARVSSKDQNLDRQIEQLEAFGVEKIFIEKQSGKDIEKRLVFQEMLEFVRDQDVLVVTELDRLGRNMQDILDTLTVLSKRGITFRALNLPQIDTNDASLNKLFSNLVLSLYSYIAESERERIRERQKQGIKIAKSKGTYQGRTPKYSLQSTHTQGRLIAQSVIEDFQNKISISKMAIKYGISRNTIYKIIEEGDKLKEY